MKKIMSVALIVLSLVSAAAYAGPRDHHVPAAIAVLMQVANSSERAAAPAGVLAVIYRVNNSVDAYEAFDADVAGGSSKGFSVERTVHGTASVPAVYVIKNETTERNETVTCGPLATAKTFICQAEAPESP